MPANSVRYALSIPKEEIWQAHAEAKRALISYASREANSGFDDEVLTIGVARRSISERICSSRTSNGFGPSQEMPAHSK